MPFFQANSDSSIIRDVFPLKLKGREKKPCVVSQTKMRQAGALSKSNVKYRRDKKGNISKAQ